MNTLGKELLSYRKVRERDAVMFDIDDTLWDMWKGIPNMETINLSQEAHRLGYKVIIITARPETSRGWTIQQLREWNVPYDGLYFTTEKGHKKKELNLTFVLSVGDNWNDLSDSIHFIKLAGVEDPSVVVF